MSKLAGSKRKAKRPTRTPTCTHALSSADWGIDASGAQIVIARWCLACGERVPIGPSNDEPEAVRVEIRAAELPLKFFALFGYANHEKRLDKVAKWPPDGRDCSEWWSGWLARELDTHDSRDERDADAWPWSTDRPVAGQYEEHLAACQRVAAEFAKPASVAEELRRALDDEPLDLLPANDLCMGCGAERIDGKCSEECGWNDSAEQEHQDMLSLHDIAADYEAQRAADPDCRDEDGPEVERLMADVTCTAPHDGPCAPAAWGDDPAVCVVPFRDREDSAERSAALARAQAQDEADEDAVPRLTSEEAAECATLSDSDVCQACGAKWTEHGQTCSGSRGYPCRVTQLTDGRTSIEPAALPRERACIVPGMGGAVTMTVSGYDPRLGPNHPDNRDPTLEPPRTPPTATNCKLLGASGCNHDPMTAEETQAVFGKERADGG